MIDKETTEAINEMIKANDGLIKVNEELMKEVKWLQSEIRTLYKRNDRLDVKVVEVEKMEKKIVKFLGNITGMIDWLVGKMYDIRDGRLLVIPEELDDYKDGGDRRQDD